jgi:hypothetical protein
MDFVTHSMRPANLLGVFVLISVSPAYAVAQLELDLKNAEEMERECRFPTAGTPANVVKDHCNARDNLYQRLKEDGWCPIRGNSQAHFLPCDSVEFRTPPPRSPIVVDQRPDPHANKRAPSNDHRILFFYSFGNYKTGETAPYQKGKMEILYLDAPCELPIMGAANMHRKIDIVGNVGCWYSSLGGGFVSIGPDGYTRHDSFWIFESAILHADTRTLTVVDDEAGKALAAPRPAGPINDPDLNPGGRH